MTDPKPDRADRPAGAAGATEVSGAVVVRRGNRYPWPWPAGVDVFWPVLAVILVVAVVFVGVVARVSLRSVGGRPSVTRSVADPTPTPVPSASQGAMTLIVQVSSQPSRRQAQAAAQRLIARGVRAKVLRSDDYSPLNTGFYVVYLGPYPETGTGRAAAERVRSTLPGSLVRDVQPR